MTVHKQTHTPNRQGQRTGSSPSRDPQYGTQGGVAGQQKRPDGKHPLQRQDPRRPRRNDGAENDDNTRAEQPVAE